MKVVTAVPESYRSFVLDPSTDPCAPTLHARTETLRTWTVHARVEARMLEAPDSQRLADEIWCRLREELTHQVTAIHRIVHGDMVIEMHEDHMRDQVVFTAKALTRRSEEGEWWAIWEAIEADGVWG